MDTITTLDNIATEYNHPIEDVTFIHNYYASKGMTESKALMYTQFAVAGLTNKSLV